MKGGAKHYEELRAYLETVPLVDSHDHTATCGPKYADPISVIAAGYFERDLRSGSSDAEMKIIADSSLSIEERWPTLQKVWNRSCHTGVGVQRFLWLLIFCLTICSQVRYHLCLRNLLDTLLGGIE